MVYNENNMFKYVPKTGTLILNMSESYLGASVA